MNVIIRLNYSYQTFTGDRENVEVQGNTVRECLDDLVGKYPVFRDLLFDSTGTLSALVLLEGEVIVPNDLDRPVSENGTLLLQPMIHGG